MLPHSSKGITIDFDCQFEVHLKDSSTLSSILAAFAELLPQLLTDFYSESTCWVW